MVQIFLLKELTRTFSIYTTITGFYLKNRSVLDLFHDFSAMVKYNLFSVLLMYIINAYH
jgi:hypothetical protein